jgi:hypothetical protein
LALVCRLPVPSQRLSVVLRYASAGLIHKAETILRYRVALIRRLP